MLATQTWAPHGGLAGEEQKRVERRWNPTVAHTTLLAIGTSAPEVLLALIDAIKHLDREPGGARSLPHPALPAAPSLRGQSLEPLPLLLSPATAAVLGPGTILGSAAFNLLVILAVCVVTPPPGEGRRIEAYGAFAAELAWSLWAYFWLLVILKFSSPGIIDIWEAAATLAQFLLFVAASYCQDRGWSLASLVPAAAPSAPSATAAVALELAEGPSP
eukprot:SM005763S18326  [mRNA]  locus=s5763:12:852:- [translate_table: standard]